MSAFRIRASPRRSLCWPASRFSLRKQLTPHESNRATHPLSRGRAVWFNRGMGLRFLTAGESHGPELVATVEGVPAGFVIDLAAINADLARRQKGYGRGGRMLM